MMTPRPSSLLILPTICLALALSLMVLPSCGYFSKDDLDVTYTEDFSINLPTIDSNKLCPSGQDCSGQGVTADMDRPLNPIEIDVEVDIVEKTGRKELADYAGKFKSVNISKIEYSIKDNSLTFDIPTANIYLAPAGVKTGSDPKAVLMAVLPETPAGMSVNAGTAMLQAENAAQLSELIQSLQLSAIAEAQPVVKKGQPFPPSGKATLSLTIYVTFVANPADAIAR